MIYPQEDLRLVRWALEVELGSNLPSNREIIATLAGYKAVNKVAPFIWVSISSPVTMGQFYLLHSTEKLNNK